MRFPTGGVQDKDSFLFSEPASESMIRCDSGADSRVWMGEEMIDGYFRGLFFRPPKRVFCPESASAAGSGFLWY